MTLAPALLLMMAQAAPDCSNAMTQADLNQCAALEFQEADAELNRAWSLASAAMKKMDQGAGADDGRKGYMAVLLEAQRAWLRFRDTHCVSEGYKARGGSMESMLVSACKAEETRLRTEQLRKLAESI